MAYFPLFTKRTRFITCSECDTEFYTRLTFEELEDLDYLDLLRDQEHTGFGSFMAVLSLLTI